jgi:PhnB protein
MIKNNNAAPAGYSTVCPYLMVPDVEKELLFLEKVFGAEVKEKLPSADGTIGHGEVRIGDSTIMMGKAQEGYPNRAMTYVFVSDADEAFKKAIALGGTAVMALGDRFYGYREGGFADPFGNQWWVAQVLRIVSPEDMERLSREQMK